MRVYTCMLLPLLLLLVLSSHIRAQGCNGVKWLYYTEGTDILDSKMKRAATNEYCVPSPPTKKTGARAGIAEVAIADVLAGTGVLDPENPNAGNLW